LTVKTIQKMKRRRRMRRIEENEDEDGSRAFPPGYLPIVLNDDDV
jgi:hypothetical protein